MKNFKLQQKGRELGYNIIFLTARNLYLAVCLDNSGSAVVGRTPKEILALIKEKSGQ